MHLLDILWISLITFRTFQLFSITRLSKPHSEIFDLYFSIRDNLCFFKYVVSNREATIAYSFVPADAFAGRPIGLTINLAYRDLEGNFFFDPVFNETVQVNFVA